MICQNYMEICLIQALKYIIIHQNVTFLLKILFLDKNNQTLIESFHQTMLFILFQFLHLYQISYNNFHTFAKVLRIINLIFLIYNRF